MSSSKKESPIDGLELDPHLEINIPNAVEETLLRGGSVKAKECNDELGELTNMYYGSHAPFENGRIEIKGSSPELVG